MARLQGDPVRTGRLISLSLYSSHFFLISEGLNVSYGWARRSVFVLASVIVCLPITVRSQTSSIGMKGSVSQVVVLSVSPSAMRESIQSETVVEGNSLRVLLSGNSHGSEEIRVPLLLRSNSAYSVSAFVESQSVIVNQLSVKEVRGTGRFVAPGAINVTVASPGHPSFSNNSPLDLSKNFRLFSGPRISLAGTLNSPDNALEVFIVIKVTPVKQAGSWQLSMTLSSTANGGL